MDDIELLSSTLQALFKVRLPNLDGSLYAYAHRGQSYIVFYDKPSTYMSVPQLSRPGFIELHFPYWIRVDYLSVGALFGRPSHLNISSEHGFTSQMPLPAHFSVEGFEYFQNQIFSLPYQIYLQVLNSLDRLSQIYGKKAVWGCYSLPER